MKTTNKSKKHQVSDAGIKAVRAGDWEIRNHPLKTADMKKFTAEDFESLADAEKRLGGGRCKCCNPKPTMQDSVFGPLPSERLAAARAAESAKSFRAALDEAARKFSPGAKKPKRTLLRGARGRFAPKAETKETIAALADAVQGSGERRSIMDRATEVRKARNQTYGGPGPEWTCQAGMLNAYMRRRFGHSPVVIQAHDIGAFNMIQKLSRHASCMSTGDYHQDNMVDAAGFADCIDEVLTAEQRPWKKSMDALLKFLTSAE